MLELPTGLVTLLVCGSIFMLMSLPLIMTRRKQIRQMSDACSELARRTGLNYISPVISLPGILFSFRWTFRNAAAQGIYRGRTASLSMTGSGGGWSGEYSESEPVQYCIIKLEVRNHAGFKLTIKPRWFLSHLFDRSHVSTGHKQFDQQLVIKGTPPDFLENVCRFLLLVNPTLLTWMIWEKPKISLKGYDLSCNHNLMTDLDQHIAILNFLCDLAELTERSGSDSAVDMIAW